MLRPPSLRPQNNQQASEFFALGLLLAAVKNLRWRVQALLAGRGEAMARAAGIAALIGDADPVALLAEARTRFRCVTLPVLFFN